MQNRNFRRSESIRKRSICSCGKENILRKRKNYPHGRNSDGRTFVFYKCLTCLKETQLVNVVKSR